MDTVSYSFSSCSDGSVSYSVTCTGSDCGYLPDLFGTVCSASDNTVTCSNNNDCSGSVNYVSSLKLSESNSTYYAVNRLSINDCADVSFVMNGTSVSPLVTSSNSQCSTTVTSTTSSPPKSASTGASNAMVASISLKSAGSSSALGSQNAVSLHSSGISAIQPNGTAISAAVRSSITTPSTTAVQSSLPSYSSFYVPASSASVQWPNGYSSLSGKPLASVSSSCSTASQSDNSSTPILIAQPSNWPVATSVKLSVASQSSAASTRKPIAIQQSSTAPGAVGGIASAANTQIVSTQSSVAIQKSNTASGTAAGIAAIAKTETTLAGPISSSSPSATILLQQSSGASRQSSRTHASVSCFLPVLLLLLCLVTQTIADSSVYSDQLASQGFSFYEHSSTNSPVHLGQPLESRGLLTEISTWYKQFEEFSSSQPDIVSNAISTIGTDILDLICEQFLDYIETGLIQQVLFKKYWQQCIALGGSFQQELQLILFSNNTNPLGNGLASHYLTVAVNTGVTLGVIHGCNLLFSELVELSLGEDLVDQTCNDWLISLGLTPPTAIIAGSGLPAGGATTSADIVGATAAPSCPTASGWELCSGECVNTLYDNNNCLGCGSVCPESSLCCNGECLDPNSEEVCGSCNITCYDGICTNGVCISNTLTCLTGWGDCNGDCTNLLADNVNCGSCGHACTGGALCSDGYCLDCPSSLPDQCGALGCVNLNIDLNNCGNCGNKCPSSDNYCFEGTCKFCDLAAGYGICPDGIFSDVDCYDLQTHDGNCGKCGNECPEESPFCVNGVCNPCPDAAETVCGIYGCVDLDTNDAFCGSCSTSCPLPQTCSGGSCVGPSG